MECLILANIIKIFHISIILFILLAPYYDNPLISILHITFSICIMIHWYHNSNLCSLTILENKLRGIEYDKTFSHQFIAPIYDISNTKWNNIVWFITILCLIICIKNLYKSIKISMIKNIYNDIKPIDSCDKFIKLINEIHKIII